MSGLSSTSYFGTIYLVKYSSTAKDLNYFKNNYKAYQDENKKELLFSDVSPDQCAKKCQDGIYGFGGRKKCVAYNYLPTTKTCILNKFTCDGAGITQPFI